MNNVVAWFLFLCMFGGCFLVLLGIAKFVKNLKKPKDKPKDDSKEDKE